MTYKPTPKGLQADIYSLLRVLAVALRNMERNEMRHETDRETCRNTDQEPLANGPP